MKNDREEKRFLIKEMTEDETHLLDIINDRLAGANLNLRLGCIVIHRDGGISTEFVPPVHKWRKENLQATTIVLEELTKYLAR